MRSVRYISILCLKFKIRAALTDTTELQIHLQSAQIHLLPAVCFQLSHPWGKKKKTHAHKWSNRGVMQSSIDSSIRMKFHWPSGTLPKGLIGVWALLSVTLTHRDFTEHNNCTDSASSALLFNILTLRCSRLAQVSTPKSSFSILPIESEFSQP